MYKISLSFQMRLNIFLGSSLLFSSIEKKEIYVISLHKIKEMMCHQNC